MNCLSGRINCSKENILSVKWKVIKDIHQVDMATSPNPVTQQSTDET